MSGDSEKVDWRKLREFAGVDVSKSFVLSWRMEGETLLIDVDLFLMPDHAFYEKPRPAEKVCIRPAIVEFHYCESVSADVSRLGHGAISDFTAQDGVYELVGEFGTVRIDAERPLLRLKGP
ncbi:MAG: hypothetical protein QNJ07_05920 [Woeseiaceae bacterium]|nr:hypothetical protein [Woeseiaceae bacterium]